MLKIKLNDKGKIVRLIDGKSVRSPATVFFKEEDKKTMESLMRVQCIKNYEINEADDSEYLEFISNEQLIQISRPVDSKKRISGSGSFDMNLKIKK